MRLLHGSNVEIGKPDLSKCHSRNDFGLGFYTTTNWKRAYGMAVRRAMRNGGEPVVSSFLFYPDKAVEHGLNVKMFKGFSAEWARFIIENRTRQSGSHSYDIVIGPVADTFVDAEIDRHQQKYGNRYLDIEPLMEFAEHISQFGNDYIQYCFCTEAAIQELFKD